MESISELRQRLYTPPILLKFDIHHSDDDDVTPVAVPERRGTREFSGSSVLKRTEICASVDGRSSKTIVTVVPDRPVPPPDDRCCLAPCFPACHTPVYRAGQVITGHLLVRPVTRLVISGVTLHVGGRCQTDWRESNVRWKASREFYVVQQPVIRNRLITLSRRWHRFDVEYQLPVDLPTSFKAADGKLVYYATASVTVVNVSPAASMMMGGNGLLSSTATVECRARDVRFRVQGRTDIASFPARLHVPAQRTAQLSASPVDIRPLNDQLQRHPLRSTENHQSNQQLSLQPEQDLSCATDRQVPDGSHLGQRRYHHRQQRARSLGELSIRLRLAEDVQPVTSTASESWRPRAFRSHRLSTRTTSEVALSTVTSPSEVDDCCAIEDDDDEDECSSLDRASGCGRSSVMDRSECCLLSAGLALDRRVFVVGDRVIADVVVSNHADRPAAFVVLFQQVLAFQADYGLERSSGKNRTQYQHYRRNIRLVVRDVGHSPASSSSGSSSAYVQPGRTIQFQRIFDLPHRLTPSTGPPIIRRRPLNVQRHLTDSSADVTTSSSVLERCTVRLDKESLISVKYFCKWPTPERLVIPIEVKVGTCDSSRTSRPGVAYCGSTGSTLDSTESWNTENEDLQNEPLNYEDYFS